MKMKLADGLGRWVDGLGGLLKRKGAEVTLKREAVVQRARTEGEKSLAAAMGWDDDPWRDDVRQAVDSIVGR